jgi:mono/diheme cytochrome c family protein
MISIKLKTLLSAGVVTLLAASCAMPYPWASGASDNSFNSNGQRIYFTGTSASGEPITYTGGFQMMHGRLACASCHGPEGKGGRVAMMMMGSFITPDITWDNLTEEEHDEGKGHDEHPPYTEETLKRAITEGLDPAGEALAVEMPRWRMSEQDLEDLVRFLKTLD